METRQERFDRDWAHIRDTRKARGWDYQANERKDIDLPDWAGGESLPGSNIYSVPVELSYDGTKRFSFDGETGGYLDSPTGEYFFAPLNNVEYGQSIRLSVDEASEMYQFGYLIDWISTESEAHEPLVGRTIFNEVGAALAVDGFVEITSSLQAGFAEQWEDDYRNEQFTEVRVTGPGLLIPVSATTTVEFVEP